MKPRSPKKEAEDARRLEKLLHRIERNLSIRKAAQARLEKEKRKPTD